MNFTNPVFQAAHIDALIGVLHKHGINRDRAGSQCVKPDSMTVILEGHRFDDIVPELMYRLAHVGYVPLLKNATAFRGKTVTFRHPNYLKGTVEIPVIEVTDIGDHVLQLVYSCNF